MLDVIECKPEKKYGFADFILFSCIKNRVRAVTGDKDLLSNINFKGILLVNDYRISPELINAIAKKGKAVFLIDISKLYNSYGVKRGILLSQVTRFLGYCIKYKMGYSFGSFAKSEKDIRSTQEIIAICSLLGLNEIQAEYGLKELKNFI